MHISCTEASCGTDIISHTTDNMRAAGNPPLYAIGESFIIHIGCKQLSRNIDMGGGGQLIIFNDSR